MTKQQMERKMQPREEKRMKQQQVKKTTAGQKKHDARIEKIVRMKS